MTKVLSIGSKFPEFKKQSVVSIEKGKEFADITNEVHKGKWMVMFWWPKDFTFRLSYRNCRV
jgi:alkyl hydroperoxide reductase subunit AhpC